LQGLKENVIVGRLIPAGTGAAMDRFKEIAAERDREILQSRQAEALPDETVAVDDGGETADQDEHETA